MKRHTTKPEMARTSVKAAENNRFDLTLGELRERIENMVASGVDLNTKVAIEQLEDELFKRDNGWAVIDYLWNKYPYDNEMFEKTTMSEPYEDYARAVIAFQIFLSKDIDGDNLIVITPHY